MKDKGFIFTLFFLIGTGLFAFICEGWNVYTGTMIGLTALLLILKKFVK